MSKQAHTLKSTYYRYVHNVYISIDVAKRKEEDGTQNNVCSKQRIKNRPVAKLTCSICVIQCTGMRNLKRHMKRHTADKKSVTDVAVEKIPKKPRNIISNTKSITTSLIRTTRSLSKLNESNNTRELYGNSVDPSARTNQRIRSDTQRTQENLLEVESQCVPLILHESQANGDDEDEMASHDLDSNSEQLENDIISSGSERESETDDDDEEKADNNDPEVSD